MYNMIYDNYHILSATQNSKTKAVTKITALVLCCCYVRIIKSEQFS